MHGLRVGDPEMICAHQYYTLVRIRIASGAEQIRQCCQDCAEVFGPAQARSRFNPEYLEDLPVVESWTHTRPPCVVCGARGTEEHHWAPRALFGEEAYVWPTAWLCPACHTRWHQTIGASA